jgi:hypothetical protein
MLHTYEAKNSYKFTIKDDPEVPLHVCFAITSRQLLEMRGNLEYKQFKVGVLVRCIHF